MTMSEITLTAEQLMLAREANQMAETAVANVGRAFLSHREIELAYANSNAQLERLRKEAVLALAQADQVTQMLLHNISPGPGDWTLDLQSGKLIEGGQTHD
jgi:hypothetical protein